MKHQSKNRLSVFFSLLFIVRASSICATCEPDDEVSKTYFSSHAPFQTVSPERDIFFRNSFIARSERLTNKFEFTVLGGTTRNSDRLARFFLPNGACSIRVASDQSPNAHMRDVNALHLNIDHDNHEFESIVTFKPKQTVVGVGFQYRQWFSRSSNKGLWYEVSFPVLRVENSMGLCENIIQPGDQAGPTRVANATQAFKQSKWQYGKAPTGCRISVVGVGDIEFKFGWEATHTDICHAETFIGFVAPTGTRPKGCFIFEPIVGNNHHWGMISGSTISIKGWTFNDHNLSFILEFNRQYLFKDKEMRSFDLIGKPWGRYMEVYRNQEAAEIAAAHPGNEALGDHGEPGINHFTQCVNVTPGYIVTFNTGYLYSYNSFRTELGYNFFTRQKEQIDCIGWLVGGTQGPALVGGQGAGKTTRTRTIGQNFAGSDQDIPNYQLLSIADLDVNSAAHPAVHSHTFYGEFGYQWEEQEYPMFLGGGVSYEFGSNNAALTRLMGWGKLGLTF